MSPVPLVPHLKPLLSTSPQVFCSCLLKSLTTGFALFGHKIAIDGECAYPCMCVRVRDRPPTCEAPLTLSSLMWCSCVSLRAEMFLKTIRIHYSMLMDDIKPYEISVVTVMQIIWQTWFASAFGTFSFLYKPPLNVVNDYRVVVPLQCRLFIIDE